MGNHIPVLLNEAIDGLNIKSNGIYLDLTLGRAGHSKEILSRLKNGLLLGFDQDEEAIKESSINLSKVSDKFELIRSNFIDFEKYLVERNITYVDGVLMDLGVSSPQFDEGYRGFSYKVDAPLDMRMDTRQKLTAKDIVNTYSVNDICDILKKYGDERYAYQIARSIVKQREIQPIISTLQLVQIIKNVKPMKVLKKEGHPAKQTFQALRIAVNDELNVLEKTLKSITKFLKPNGGRLVVITFHSGEDRIVKTIFKDLSITIGNRIDGPSESKEKEFFLVNTKPIVASKEEIERNHRSTSAKMRILERK